MNQQNTPTQQSPRPKPKGYVGRPIHLPKKCAPPKGLVITTVVTGALLVISLMILSIALLVGPTEQVVVDGGGVPSKQEQSASSDKPTDSNSSTGILPKTDVQLPCATTAAKKSYSTAGMQEISVATPTQAAILIDVTNGRVVAQKQGEERIYPASMTKVMTLLVACENATSPTALLTVTDAMVAKYKTFYDSSTGEGPSIATAWKAGDQITVEDALHLVIYESDTYACWLLAEYVAGSEEAFVQRMNERAVQIGCSDTLFQNATGLFDENHYTTCFDMALMMAEAMNNAAAKFVLSSYEQYFVDVYRDGVKSERVAMWSGWCSGRLEKFGYPKTAARYAGKGSDILLIAGKTGYETVPKYCFVTAGEHDQNDTLYVCVQVGGASPSDSTYATREIYQTYAKDS